MLDGRCSYKKKLGINEETNKVHNKVLQVKWEPTQGNVYAVLFDKKIDIMGTDSDRPKSSVASDIANVCFDFVTDKEIVIADVNGRLSYLKGILSEETTTVSIVSTKSPRFRDIKFIPGSNYVCTISTEGQINFWEVDSMQKLQSEMVNGKAVKTIKSKSRLLCLSLNHVNDPQEQAELNKQKEKSKERKKLKRKNKVTKDEKLILKRQKVSNHKEKAKPAQKK